MREAGQDAFERLLDEELTAIAGAAPRTGLDARVMARVRAEGVAGRSAWLPRGLVWSLAGAAACAALMLAGWDGQREIGRPLESSTVPLVRGVGTKAELPAHAPSSSKGTTTTRSAGRASGRGPKVKGGGSSREAYPRESAAEPRLDVFPAVAQRGDVKGWLGGGAVLPVGAAVPPIAFEELQDLRRSQSEPLRVAEINIPLLPGTEIDGEENR